MLKNRQVSPAVGYVHSFTNVFKRIDAQVKIEKMLESKSSAQKYVTN